MTRSFLTSVSLTVIASVVAAQSPTHLACREASTDAFATTAGTAMLVLPGIASDFVMTAGGQLTERADGTAHLSALLYRASEIDRQLLLDLELQGLTLPGAPNHPPANALPLELLGNAYVPTGSVDPLSFRYYTTGTGRLLGYAAYGGARFDIALAAPLQIGVGANNRNVLLGMAASLSVQVTAQPNFLVLTPTGNATLTSTLASEQVQCASHVDRDSAGGTGTVFPDRLGLRLPGVADDYVFIPAGEWVELSDGSAHLDGTLRREDDFEDRWHLSLTCQSRVGPNDASFPPVEGPVFGLQPSAYVGAGGIVDPSTFRYYRTAVGTLAGEGLNAGGVVDIAATRPVQIGVGADNGNRHFGGYAELSASIASQPTGRVIAVTGGASLHFNVATLCILPYPNQTPGLHWVLDNVTDDVGLMTGQNLAWVEQMTIGSRTITANNQRNFANGYLKVVSGSLVEIHPPQGMVPGTYTTRAFTRSLAGGFRQMTLQLPAQPVIRTNIDRFASEAQDWFLSQGNVQGPTLALMALSNSNLPSIIPGFVTLGMGNQFANLVMIPATLFPNTTTGAASFRIPRLPVGLQGRLYCQGVVVSLSNPNALPLITTDVRFTDYLH